MEKTKKVKNRKGGKTMKNGTKVIRKGSGKKYLGTVTDQYGDRMVEVNFPGGLATIDIESLTEVFWSNELTCFVTIPDITDIHVVAPFKNKNYKIT